jgi:diguanylate cyclase (GGDEF)-like protein
VSENFVLLHIGDAVPSQSLPTPAGQSDLDVFRSTLDEAFGTLADVLTAGDAGSLTEVLAGIERCRAALTGDVAAEFVVPIARACFDSTKSVAAHTRNKTAERRTQIAELVAMVRETVHTIAGDQTNIQETLAGSAERLERIAHADDLHLIQVKLRQEVARLTRITMERRAAWEKTVKDFGTRLANLETQLDRTRREAATDPLTNVPNRRSFEATCREWMAPNRPGFVMAMVDVDDFKKINDRYGHGIGDRVLVLVAETLARSLRAEDVVARIGGDEFAVLASSLTLTQAEGRFAAIGRAVQEACKPLVEDARGPSISIGLAECSAGDTLRSLQQRADAALYQAKRSGKGRLATKAVPLIRDLLKER